MIFMQIINQALRHRNGDGNVDAERAKVQSDWTD